MSISETAGEVAVLRWPDEAAERWRLASLGTPRLLVIEDGAEPPLGLDALEDWVRGPADPADLLARTENLRRRASAITAPSLDDDGLLRFEGRWVDVPDTQLPVVDLLVRNLGHLVRTEELTAAYESGGGSGHSGSIQTVVFRIRARVAAVGLVLRVVRGRGVVLDRPRPADA